MLGLIAHRLTPTNRWLLAACDAVGLEAALLSPREALTRLGPGDTALARLDVRRTFDGVEDGVWHLRRLERGGVRVLNRAPALLAAHDKLQTARRLEAAGLPHPRTSHVSSRRSALRLATPVVLKPRFGSWGGDVFLCEGEDELQRNLSVVRQRDWFWQHGVLAQGFVAPQDHDLRLVVAAGQVIGAVRRVPAPGEWRTNVALGASRVPVEPTAGARALAVAATAAVEMDLAGVDLIPAASGEYVVIEVNGAVDFTRSYLRGADVFAVAVTALLSRDAGAEQALA